MTEPISLERRLQDYREAESAAEQAAEKWLEAKAAHKMTVAVQTNMMEAERECLRAKRRYEKAARKSS